MKRYFVSDVILLIHNFKRQLFLNSINFLTGKDNAMINPILDSRDRLESYLKHIRHAPYVFELIAVFTELRNVAPLLVAPAAPTKTLF